MAAFFKKMGDKLKAKIDKTKHNMAVASEINHIFSRGANRYTLIDAGAKGIFKVLLEKDEEAKNFYFFRQD